MIYKISAPVAIAHQLDAPSVQRNGEILPRKSGQTGATRYSDQLASSEYLEGNEGGVVEVEKAARSRLSGFKAQDEEPPEFSWSILGGTVKYCGERSEAGLHCDAMVDLGCEPTALNLIDRFIHHVSTHVQFHFWRFCEHVGMTSARFLIGSDQYDGMRVDDGHIFDLGCRYAPIRLYSCIINSL
jgi:hypothetical protein